MANLFIVTVTQKNSAPYKNPQQAAFDTSESLIVEDYQYAPNNAYILYAGNKYYTGSTAEQLVTLANESGSETILATIIQVDGNQRPSLKYGFPTQNISIWPATGVNGAACAILFKNSNYYAIETLQTFVAAGNQPADIHFGDPGDPAGPLGGDGKIPVEQLPPLQHDVAEAASEAEMLALDMTAPAQCVRTDFTPAHIFYLHGNPASDINNWKDVGVLQADAGNPTAKVGLTATNGSANTRMRSDGAPALDQSIAPTWTGAHVFGAQSGNSNPTVQLSSINPQFEIRRSDAGVDSGRWNFGVSPTQFTFRTLNDAGNANQVIWSINRAANAVTEQQWFIGGTQLLNLIASYFQINVPTINVTGADGVKMWLAKYTGGTGHNNAPTAIGATSNYLQVGGREYGNNGYGGIGFGYVSAMTDHPCVWVGYEEKNTAGNTSGDFLVAVRNATTNTAPVEAFRIAQNKDASFQGNLTVAGTITAAGLSGVVASDGKNAQAANINSPTFYAVPTSGMYRVSAFVVLTQAATTSSVLPSCNVSYTEATSGVAVQDIVTQTANTNQVGLHVGGSVVISARQGANIGYTTSNYASSGATPMQYSIHIKVEFLGQ